MTEIEEQQDVRSSGLGSVLDGELFNGGEGQSLGVLSRVKIKMTVEVGRTSMTLKDLMALSEGSIVELDRVAGDPLDILVNGVLIARGEVVKVGDKFGVRFGEIVESRRAQETG